MNTRNFLTILNRALKKLRGKDADEKAVGRIEDIIDLSTSTFPRLSPVVKYPVFRKPPLDSENILHLSLEFLKQVVVRNVDAKTLRELYEDREAVTITPVSGIQIYPRGKPPISVDITRLETRIANPLLERLYAVHGNDWEQVSEFLSEHLQGAVEQAAETSDAFDTSMDDIRAYTFSLGGVEWRSAPIFVSGFTIYVHWLAHLFYLVVGETERDFDDWVRYGRVGAATNALFVS